MRYLAALLFVALLAACTAEPQAAPMQITCPDGSLADSLDDCPEDEPETDDVEVVAPPTPTAPVEEPVGRPTDIFTTDETPTAPVPAELSAIIDRAEEREEKGYSFIYKGFSDGLGDNTPLQGSPVLVRGDLRAAELPSNSEVEGKPATYVIADLAAGTATAYCDRCKTDQEFSVDPGLFLIPMPIDWLHIIEDVEMRSTTSIGGRQAREIRGTIDGMPVTVFSDTYSGVPLEVNMGDRSVRYERFSIVLPSDAFSR